MGRRGLKQPDLAERMKALGYKWLRQTVGDVMTGRRSLRASEILALSLALETSIAALTAPADEDAAVTLPSGEALSAESVRRSARGQTRGAVRWDGNVPVFPPVNPPGWWMPPEANEEDELQPVVAAIVTSDLGVLVGRRNDGKPPWTFIAGEQEPGERADDTAIREVKEETTLRIQAGDIIGQRVHPKTGRTMVYMAARPTHGTEIFVGDEDELAEVRWVSLAEADELLPGMFEPVREHLVRELGRA